MIISEIIYELFIILFDFAVMYMLLAINLKIVKKLNILLSVIIFSLSLVSSIYVAGNYGRASFTSYFPLLVLIPMYIVFYLVSKYRGAKLFFVFISTFIFSTPILRLPYLVGVFVDYSIKIMTIASLFTYIITLVIVNKYIAPLFHYALENLHNNWRLLCFLPITYTLLSYLTDGDNHTLAAWHEYSYFRILFLAVIYSAYMVILVFFKQIREQLLWKNEQAILTLQMDSMREHLNELKNSQTMASIYRHDLRHHLQYVNTCILQSNFVESSNYIMSICSEIEASSVVLYCENDGINMILSSYVTKAKSAETDITIDASIPSTIHITTTDLCVVLANGIENAIFACKKTNGSEMKKIHLSCHIKNNKILIQITNPYDGEIEFREGLPIAHKDGHGTGIKSIVNIVKKYKGIYSFVASDNIFTLSVII